MVELDELKFKRVIDKKAVRILPQILSENGWMTHIDISQELQKQFPRVRGGSRRVSWSKGTVAWFIRMLSVCGYPIEKKKVSLGRIRRSTIYRLRSDDD